MWNTRCLRQYRHARFGCCPSSRSSGASCAARKVAAAAAGQAVAGWRSELIVNVLAQLASCCRGLLPACAILPLLPSLPRLPGILDFWTIGTPSRNTIRCSKNHLHCHTSFLATVGKRGEFANRLLHKYSNSRLMGKVPQRQGAGSRGQDTGKTEFTTEHTDRRFAAAKAAKKRGQRDRWLRADG